MKILPFVSSIMTWFTEGTSSHKGVVWDLKKLMVECPTIVVDYLALYLSK